MRIIYEVDTTTKKVAVVIPTPEWLVLHTMEQLAAKVVPSGANYEIVGNNCKFSCGKNNHKRKTA